MKEPLNETTEPLPPSVTGSQATAQEEESDFIDFYQILGFPVDATPDLLSNRITDLYNEAQNNHDHRNPAKRMHYAAMSELLPFIRIVLMQPEKRASYDSYLTAFRGGSTGLPDFESIIKEIVGQVSLNSTNTTDVIALNDEPLEEVQTAVKSELKDNVNVVPSAGRQSAGISAEKTSNNGSAPTATSNKITATAVKPADVPAARPTPQVAKAADVPKSSVNTSATEPSSTGRTIVPPAPATASGPTQPHKPEAEIAPVSQPSGNRTIPIIAIGLVIAILLLLALIKSSPAFLLLGVVSLVGFAIYFRFKR
jgi:hypothetical protein